jgi:hypothetical protein
MANHNLHSLYLHNNSSRDAASFRRFYNDAQDTLDGIGLNGFTGWFMIGCGCLAGT